MASHVEIKYIKRSNSSDPVQQIISIGGINPDGTPWSRTYQETIEDVESGRYKYFVGIGGKCRKVIIAVDPYGEKHMIAATDNETSNNLLSLPEPP